MDNNDKSAISKGIKRILLRAGVSILVALVVGLIISIVNESNMGPKIDELSGTWQTTRSSEIQWFDVLEQFDFYEEEIQIIKDSKPSYISVLGGKFGYSVKYSELIIFTQDRTYTFKLSETGTKELVQSELTDIFQTLYDNKEKLSTLYDIDFTDLTQDEFNNFYALIYDYASFDEMIENFASNLTKALANGYEFEEGTYKIKGDKIMCIESGKGREEAIGYTIDGDVLNLQFKAEIGTGTTELIYNRLTN